MISCATTSRDEVQLTYSLEHIHARIEDAACNLFGSAHGQVVNIPNSMTVLTDLLPVSLIMAERKLEVSGTQAT